MSNVAIKYLNFRDQKESELKTYKEQERASENAVIRYKSEFEKKLASYHQWCKENNVQPNEYPFPK